MVFFGIDFYCYGTSKTLSSLRSAVSKFLLFQSSVGRTIDCACINLCEALVSYLSESYKVGDWPTPLVLRSVSTENIQKTLVLCMSIDVGTGTTKLMCKFIRKLTTQKAEDVLLVGKAIGL